MTAADTPRGLLLVDDHTIVREGVRRILEPLGAGWSITEAGTAFQALECLRNARFHLAIVDLSLPGMSGLDLVRRLKSQTPETAVLVLSMHAEEQYAIRAFKAGANGYLTKDGAAAELLAAVRKVADGGAYITPNMAEQVVLQLNRREPRSDHHRLSDRELQVLRLIVSGSRLTDIAEGLHLSIKTVSTHKSHIQQKLGLDTMAALIRYGLEHRLDLDDASGLGS